MGLDVYMVDEHGEDVPASGKDYPYLCGYHLWQGIGKLAFEPNGTPAQKMALPYSFYSDLSPQALKDQFIAVDTAIRTGTFVPANDIEQQEAESLHRFLFDCAEAGYGTSASF